MKRAPIRPIAAITALLLLPACSLLFPEDPRVGTESADECAARVGKALGPASGFRQFDQDSGVPIYTFDITKMAFEDIQALMVAGSDDSAGARERLRTNETSTAVDNFMAMSVDEKGAFFMARDPALYRVRGAFQPVDTMIATGCARQQAGMRLTRIDVASARAEPDPETSSDSENENENDS